MGIHALNLIIAWAGNAHPEITPVDVNQMKIAGARKTETCAMERCSVMKVASPTPVRWTLKRLSSVIQVPITHVKQTNVTPLQGHA